ncbi:lactate racemase domain-containing protein [Tundrisphaera sp. TA3]|uniref:lactate racemase domain-containing protein n=1 Tax=Tundrisphaera sp. TA3 TaxID=3435775 RepID=UPI003EBAF94C
MDLPLVARVRQNFPRPRVDDVPATVRGLIEASRLRDRVKPGGRVAIAVGSRGIAEIATIARAAVDAVAALGFRPFLVAAMGSHGGATAEGQREILAGYGITPEAMGVEVRTDMDTVVVGTSPIGVPIPFDRNAFEADGIVAINRVKPHTDFTGRYESGLVKMLAVGLGKREGAYGLHTLGVRGLRDMLPRVAATIIEKTPFALGLAILENASDEPAEIVAVEPEALLEAEPALLDRARSMMGRLPFHQIDVLVIGELGKNYSGAGIDPNVTGRLLVETMPDLPTPVVTRLAVLDASEETHGNLVGIGFADLTTERLVARLDPESFRINTLTSRCLERSRIPITLPTDRDVAREAVSTCWQDRPERARVVIIPNTRELTTLWVSQPFADEVAAHPGLTPETDFGPWPFREDGTLDQEAMFPDSLRARRGTPAHR